MRDILFMTQYFYPEYVSSAVLPYDTAVQLCKDGYKIGVLCGYPYEYSNLSDVPVYESVHGIKIKRLKYLGVGRKGIIGRCINFLSFFLAVLINLRSAKNYKCIIVYSDPPILPLLAIIAKKIYHSKIVFVCYDVYPEIGIRSGKFKKNGLISRIFRLINKIVYNSVDKVVALSTDMKKFININRNINNNKIDVIHNWGDDKEVLKYTSNDLFSIPNDAFVVSYLGNLGVCQDSKTLISSMIKNKNNKIHYIIAGHGSKMYEITEAIKKYDLKNVHYYDFLHDNDYELALARTNAFIVSLINNMEGLCSPSKACNYFKSGKPVLIIGGTEIEMAKQIKDYNCGYCIKNGDYNAFLNAVNELVNNKQLANLMGTNARLLYEKEYSKNNTLQKYTQMLKDIIK